MPFPIWCTTCPKPTIIAQGVRFNAEKKKVGNYYSTAIFSFRMKHNVCGGAIEIQTDPKNTAYVVTEGAKRRDTGEDKETALGDGEIFLEGMRVGEEVKEKDPFEQAEGKGADKAAATEQQTRVKELKRLRDRDWADPYEASRRLRKPFREQRKIREADEAKGEHLATIYGLGVEMLPEIQEDGKRAALVEFGEPRATIEGEDALREVAGKPLFGNGKGEIKGTEMPDGKNRKRKEKPEDVAKRKREALQRELRGNTMAVIDPFLGIGKDFRSNNGRIIPGVKKKLMSSITVNDEVELEENNVGARPVEQTLRLVDYDSDG